MSEDFENGKSMVKKLSDWANFIQLAVIIFGGGILYQKVETLIQDNMRLQNQIYMFQVQISDLSKQNAQFEIRLNNLEYTHKTGNHK